MHKRANPTLIGAFVVGAIALSIGAIMLIGSGVFFRDVTTFVLFFPGSVDGLEIGAPVKFRGVSIGAVKDVRLALDDLQQSEARLPVFIEIDNKRLRAKGGGSGRTDAASVRELVDLGLRAQLRTRSLLTGLLFVQLDLRPDTPARFVLEENYKYGEIPTIPAPFDQVQTAAERFLAKLDRTKIDELVAQAIEAIDHIDHVISDPSLRAAVESLPQTLASIDKAAASIRQLSSKLDERSGPVLESTREAALAATAALSQATVTLQTVQNFTEPNSPFAFQLDVALTEFTDAARAVRLLAEYLERNPGSVVRGRPDK